MRDLFRPIHSNYQPLADGDLKICLSSVIVVTPERLQADHSTCKLVESKSSANCERHDRSGKLPHVKRTAIRFVVEQVRKSMIGFKVTLNFGLSWITPALTERTK